MLNIKIINLYWILAFTIPCTINNIKIMFRELKVLTVSDTFSYFLGSFLKVCCCFFT